MNALSQFENALLRHGIGLDSRFFERAAADNSGFPPHNIQQIGDDRFRLTLAVAGFSEDDITITVHQDLLTVEGSGRALPEGPDVLMLYRGIGQRDFSRQFKVGEHVSVDKASLVNGLLEIDLVREIPEVMKPKRIPLS